MDLRWPLVTFGSQGLPPVGVWEDVGDDVEGLPRTSRGWCCLQSKPRVTCTSFMWDKVLTYLNQNQLDL